MQGSPKYLSPEVITSNAPAHPSMDIWALGIILYKLLHGVYPFEADNRRDIFEKIKKGEFTVHPDILHSTSKACVSLIRQMLQTDPAKRPTTVEISNHPWLTKELEQM